MQIAALTPLLNVADPQASLDWYAHLGFQAMRRFEHDGRLDWALAGNGPLRLMLNRQHRIAAAERLARPHYGDAVLYLTVDDAAAAHRALAAAGLAPGPVERQAYGVDEFSLRDPDGYAIAVISEPLQLA